MEIKEELLVEAVEELLAAEREALDSEDWSQRHRLIQELMRREDNYDCIASRLMPRLLLMNGVMSKLFIQAVAYRVTRKKLFGAGSWEKCKNKTYRRHWYARWDRAKLQLKNTLELYHDEEARKTGKVVWWHLMEKHCGKSHVMSSSMDKDYIRALHNDAIGRPHTGTAYFMVKEYKDAPRRKEAGNG